MDYLTKNITYSKAGATITCLGCGDSDTYQIGKLDKEKWARERGKYKCKDCRALRDYTPVFYLEEASDIDKLLEMI